jgi:hypothetical protein
MSVSVNLIISRLINDILDNKSSDEIINYLKKEETHTLIIALEEMKTLPILNICVFNHFEVFKWLIEVGVAPFIKDASGKTTLDYLDSKTDSQLYEKVNNFLTSIKEKKLLENCVSQAKTTEKIKL